jgi:3-oxoadipate enol-lactonase
MSMLIKTAQLRLNVVDEGPRAGPVVMLSHSLAANLEMWAPQAQALAREFRVIRYDTRGHGGSDAPHGAYSFTQLTGDVIALLDALEIERVHFVGLSLGGMTAMGLALDHPQRIASICAANCGAQTPDGGAAMWQERIATARGQGMTALAEPTLARWFTADMLATRKSEVAAVRAMILATPVAGYVGCCEALKTLAYRDRLNGLQVPALFIAGSEDPAVPVAAMRDMHARVSGSRYVELPAAHLSNLECAVAFNTALGDFLRAQP